MQTTPPRGVPSGFDSLGLSSRLLRAVRDAGHTTPTSIQARAIPPALEGRDLVALAQTGTGKTAAFALPILHRLIETKARARERSPLALVLSPTRELSSQIAASFEQYGKHSGLSTVVIFGGVGAAKQISAIERGVDILVATPGRLEDLFRSGHVELDDVRYFVLDEADRMLDPGFLPSVRRVVKALSKERQTLLFSATMPSALEPLIASFLRDAIRVEAAPVASTPDRIDQSLYFVAKDAKRELLPMLLKDPEVERAIVFTRTKHGANRVVKQLAARGVDSAAIHGNKSQSAREKALGAFRHGTMRVLVATDIAARGIDVSGVTHVVNFDLPDDPESYVHRIGRTARAGAVGKAYTLCSPEERPLLQRVERLTMRRIPIVEAHPYADGATPNTPDPAPERRPLHGQRRLRGNPQSSRSPMRSAEGGAGSAGTRRRGASTRSVEVSVGVRRRNEDAPDGRKRSDAASSSAGRRRR